MNRFDEKYEIRFAEQKDIDGIMDFIGRYWKKGHIMACRRDVFKYSYMDEGKVNFLIAVERESGEIHAQVGFGATSHDKARLDTWGGLMKSREDVAMKMLGTELRRRRRKYLNIRSEIGIGLNPQTSARISSVIFKEPVFRLSHYYCVADKKDYAIAKIGHTLGFKGNTQYTVYVEQFSNIDDIKKKFDFEAYREQIPYKDAWYIDRRYLSYPFFSYQVYGLSEADNIVRALLVCREQEYAGEKALRVVDLVGEERLFGGLSAFFSECLNKYEYIDFYEYGIPDSIMEQAGMVKQEDGDANIIPNYFYPFVQKNIDIWGSFYPNTIKCRICKADGDQDFPN